MRFPVFTIKKAIQPDLNCQVGLLRFARNDEGLLDFDVLDEGFLLFDRHPWQGDFEDAVFDLGRDLVAVDVLRQHQGVAELLG